MPWRDAGMDTLYQLTRALPIIQLSVRFKYRRQAFVKIGFNKMIKVGIKKFLHWMRHAFYFNGGAISSRFSPYSDLRWPAGEQVSTLLSLDNSSTNSPSSKDWKALLTWAKVWTKNLEPGCTRQPTLPPTELLRAHKHSPVIEPAFHCKTTGLRTNQRKRG